MNHLETIQQTLKPELEALNRIITDSLATNSELMNEVVTTYLRTKGKQIRPILVILSAKMLGEVNEHVLYAGAALEMLHNASLIHDDVVDDTKKRRGVDTINSIWDNHISVLVGDFFVSNSLAAGIHTGRISIISALSNLGKELSLGEIEQICNARDHHFDENKYMSMIRKKTASLFINCIQMGAEAGNANPDKIKPMLEYAELLGLCFQIKDDIFDYFNDDKIGKPTGNDLREGKVTLPLLYALNNAPKKIADNMKQLIIDGNLSEPDISTLIDFAKANGGIDYAYTKMLAMQQRADKIICQYPDNDARQLFREIFDYIIRRDK